MREGVKVRGKELVVMCQGILSGYGDVNINGMIVDCSECANREFI